MNKKKVSAKRPGKKAHGASDTLGSKSNVERKKSRHSLQSSKQNSQSGFSEPDSQRGMNIDYDEGTMVAP